MKPIKPVQFIYHTYDHNTYEKLKTGINFWHFWKNETYSLILTEIKNLHIKKEHLWSDKL